LFEGCPRKEGVTNEAKLEDNRGIGAIEQAVNMEKDVTIYIFLGRHVLDASIFTFSKNVLSDTYNKCL